MVHFTNTLLGKFSDHGLVEFFPIGMSADENLFSNGNGNERNVASASNGYNGCHPDHELPCNKEEIRIGWLQEFPARIIENVR